ncbi:hypothetical protein M1O16_00710 [Dehalococcoidia bacterium]|nr:hypothetical protein [Dehalococcoidia bacterium]
MILNLPDVSVTHDVSEVPVCENVPRNFPQIGGHTGWSVINLKTAEADIISKRDKTACVRELARPYARSPTLVEEDTHTCKESCFNILCAMFRYNFRLMIYLYVYQSLGEFRLCPARLVKPRC